MSLDPSTPSSPARKPVREHEPPPAKILETATAAAQIRLDEAIEPENRSKAKVAAVQAELRAAQAELRAAQESTRVARRERDTSMLREQRAKAPKTPKAAIHAWQVKNKQVVDPEVQKVNRRNKKRRHRAKVKADPVRRESERERSTKEKQRYRERKKRGFWAA